MLGFLLTVSGLAFSAGCTDASSSGGPPDLGVLDLASAEDLASAGDLATSPTGSSLVAGAGLHVIGLTSDDRVVYDDSKGALFSVPTAGGQPVMIDSGFGQVRIRNKAVFSWSSYDPPTNVGTLTVYTPAAGAVQLAPGSIGLSSGASDDGKYLAWAANAGAAASVFIGTADGKTKMEVIQGLSSKRRCLPTFAWWKDAFVVLSCADAGDAGVTPAAIHLVDPQTFAVTELVSDAIPFFSIDDAGKALFTIDTAGNGIVKMRGQSTSTVIASGVPGGFITNDGNAVVYATTGGALKRWTSTGTTTLVPSNVGGLLAEPPGQGSVLFYNQSDDNTGLNDLFLTSATAALTPQQLVATTTASVYGDSFTTDEKFALYQQNVDPHDFAGTLTAWPIQPGGGPARTIAQRVWLSLAGTGEKVIYDDNFVAMGNSGYGDLKVVDLAGSPTPTVIAPAVDADFFVTAARDKVVFSVNQAKGKEGVYVAPVP